MNVINFAREETTKLRTLASQIIKLILLSAAKTKQIFALQVRYKSDKVEKKTELDKELSQYDTAIKKETLVEVVKTEADLARVPPEILVKVLPKPIESRNRVLIVGAGKLPLRIRLRSRWQKQRTQLAWFAKNHLRCRRACHCQRFGGHGKGIGPWHWHYWSQQSGE